MSLTNLRLNQSVTMPSTLHGIGTAYYGRRNNVVYRGYCGNCRCETPMEDYETTHWVVVFYAPIIPLGKKQIVGDCANCRCGGVTTAAKWKSVTETALRDQMAIVSGQPDNFEAALHLFNLFASFNRKDDAARLAEVMIDRFPDRLDLRLRLGSWFESVGRMTESAEQYQRALELDPDNLTAKHSVAMSLIRSGNADGAYCLLTAAPEMRVRENPSLYMALADAYERHNQFDSAVKIYAMLLEAIPAMGRDSLVRKRVAACERRSAQAVSMLPTIPIHKRPWFIATACVVFLLSVVVASQWYVANFRKLHIVNGFSRAVDVRIDGGDSVRVEPHGFAKVSIAEGPHTAVIACPGRDEIRTEFSIDATWYDRFLKSPVFVLNVDGAAVVVREKTTYHVKNAIQEREGDYEIDYHVGQSFVAFADADYAFQPFPDELTLKNGDRNTKTRVGMETFDAAQVLQAMPEAVSIDDRLAYVEAHLRTDSDDAPLFASYLHTAFHHGRTERCREFLEAGLDRTPVNVRWHRTHQELRRLLNDDETLADEYRERLGGAPRDSTLLYLCARVEPDALAADFLIDQSIASDPDNAYAWFFKANRLYRNGDFEEARSACENACRLCLDDSQFGDQLNLIRSALGESATLEIEFRRELKERPTSSDAFWKVLESLAPRNEREAMRKLLTEFESNLRAADPQAVDIRREGTRARLALHYFLGNHQQVLDEAASLSDAAERTDWEFAALLELGRLEDAAMRLHEDSGDPPYRKSLCLSIAWRDKGDDDKANRAFLDAVTFLEGGDAGEKSLALLLQGAPELSFTEARTFVANSPAEKALFLVVLAEHCPAHRAALVDLAERLNFSPWSPQPLLAKAIARLRSLPTEPKSKPHCASCIP